MKKVHLRIGEIWCKYPKAVRNPARSTQLMGQEQARKAPSPTNIGILGRVWGQGLSCSPLVSARTWVISALGSCWTTNQLFNASKLGPGTVIITPHTYFRESKGSYKIRFMTFLVKSKPSLNGSPWNEGGGDGG